MKSILLLVLLLAVGACEREQRQFKVPAEESGTWSPLDTRADENAYAVAQGKTLFRWFNCSGCHAMGGGGMGVPLMDKEWRYGDDPKTIFQTIMDGRPGGMPAFRGRISEDQAWQLVAYVRSLSGMVAQDVAPGRRDGLSAAPPENMRSPP